MRIAVLASGRGSNLAALLAAQARDGGFSIVLVAGDRPAAAALGIATAAGIAVWAERPSTFPDRSAFDAALAAVTGGCAPDMVLCAGYMRLLGPAFLHQLQCPVLNIHPSLLPRHPGLDTHRQALLAADAFHGATVHLVTEQLDGGTRLAQARFPVPAGIEVDTLAKMTLRHEHRLLPAVVTACSRGELDPSVPSWHGQPLSAPLQLAASGNLEAAAPIAKANHAEH